MQSIICMSNSQPMQQRKEIALRIWNPTKGTIVMYLKKMYNI